MATLEKLKEHAVKTKERLDAETKKADDPKNDPAVRKIRKKYKRLTRKAAKIVYMEKKKQEKTKKKKGGE